MADKRRGKRGKKTREVVDKTIHESENVVVKVLEFGGDRNPDRGTSKQLPPDLFEPLIVNGEVIRPPYNPLMWALLLEQNTRVNRCVHTMALNTVGHGFAFESMIESKSFIKKNRKNIEEERARVAPLFRFPNNEQSFEEILIHIKIDEESQGQGYMEVSRDGKGDIDGFYHAPGHTIRVRAGDIDGYVQMRTTYSGELSSFPGQTAVDGGVSKVYFKRFGDPRVINKDTGEVVKEGLPIEDRANELIMFKIYSPRSSYYGVPRYVTTAPAIAGNRLAQLRNVSFFENDAVPRLAVIVQGGRLDAEAVETIRSFIESKGKGVMNASRVMILQPEKAEGVPVDESQRTRIELMPLTVGVTEDASFTRYLMLNNEDIREAFGIGKIFLGTVDDVNRACYSDDTETLTKGGWKKFEELTGDEEVLAVNPKTGEGEYLKPDKLCVYPYKGKMIEVENRGTSFKVTPDHKVLFRSGTDDKCSWKESTAEKMVGYKRFRVRVSPKNVSNGDEQEFFILPGVDVKNGANDVCKERNKGPWKIPMEMWSKFIGYFVSEGFIGDHEKNGNYVIGISQNEEVYPEKVEEIRSMLCDFPYTFSESCYEDGMVRWTISWKALWMYLNDNCGRGAINKRLPVGWRNWDFNSLERLFWAMIDGDGHIYPDRGTISGNYFSISKQLADDFQELCVLTNRRGQIRVAQDRRPNRRIGYVINWAERDRISVYQDSCREVEYDGNVHCFSLPKHHFYVTRRNGKLAIQGNSAYTSKQVTTEQVFEPESKRYEYRINATIMRDLNAEYTRFVLTRPKTIDLTQEAMAFATLAAAGGITPNDIRSLLGYDPFSGNWADTPLPLIKEGILEGQDMQPQTPEGEGGVVAQDGEEDMESKVVSLAVSRANKVYRDATGFSGTLNLIAEGKPDEVMKSLQEISEKS